jgi:hypothetical protein
MKLFRKVVGLAIVAKEAFSIVTTVDLKSGVLNLASSSQNGHL